MAQPTDQADVSGMAQPRASMITAGGARPRVLLADDHTLIVEGLAQLLAAECDIVGTVGDGLALVTEAERLKPDVVVLDIMMPVMNGLDAARELKRRLPRTRIVCLTMNQDPDVAKEALRIGVSGFVLKHSAASELMTAIRAVIGGRSYVTPRVTRDLVDACADPRARHSEAEHDHAAAARDPAAARRRSFDEAGSGGPAHHAEDRRLSQVSNDGAAPDHVHGRADSVRDQTAHRRPAGPAVAWCGWSQSDCIRHNHGRAAWCGERAICCVLGTAGRRSWPRPGSADGVAGARL